jgi:hypothetical protein
MALLIHALGLPNDMNYFPLAYSMPQVFNKGPPIQLCGLRHRQISARLQVVGMQVCRFPTNERSAPRWGLSSGGVARGQQRAVRAADQGARARAMGAAWVISQASCTKYWPPLLGLGWAGCAPGGPTCLGRWVRWPVTPTGTGVGSSASAPPPYRRLVPTGG